MIIGEFQLYTFFKEVINLHLKPALVFKGQSWDFQANFARKKYERFDITYGHCSKNC